MCSPIEHAAARSNDESSPFLLTAGGEQINITDGKSEGALVMFLCVVCEEEERA